MFTLQFFISIKGNTNLTGITRSSFPQITRVGDFIRLILILLAVVLCLRDESNASLAPGIDILSWTREASLLPTSEVVVSDNAFFISAFDVAPRIPVYF